MRWLQDHGLTAAGTLGLGANTLLLLGLAGALAILVYRCVELPALRHKVGAHQERRIATVPADQVQAAP